MPKKKKIFDSRQSILDEMDTPIRVGTDTDTNVPEIKSEDIELPETPPLPTLYKELTNDEKDVFNTNFDEFITYYRRFYIENVIPYMVGIVSVEQELRDLIPKLTDSESAIRLAEERDYLTNYLSDKVKESLKSFIDNKIGG
jgi:hypothetical protein